MSSANRRSLDAGAVMSPSVVLLICAVAFGVGGVVFYSFARRVERQGNASRSWPTVPGRVLSSEIRRGQKGNISPAITYRYAIAGKDYTGTRASFAGTTGQAESSRLVNAFPVGAAVSVAYDPADPASAVLEVGAKGTRGMMMFGILMMVLAAVALVGALLV
jgi:hypothetical protein